MYLVFLFLFYFFLTGYFFPAAKDKSSRLRTVHSFVDQGVFWFSFSYFFLFGSRHLPVTCLVFEVVDLGAQEETQTVEQVLVLGKSSLRHSTSLLIISSNQTNIIMRTHSSCCLATSGTNTAGSVISRRRAHSGETWGACAVPAKTFAQQSLKFSKIFAFKPRVKTVAVILRL